MRDCGKCVKVNVVPYFYDEGENGLFPMLRHHCDSDIEYFRADAFIDKAWSWIEDNMLSSNQQDKSHFYYEQFINYMKGE